MSFDPEKVEKLCACHQNTGVVVLASDYDQLLALYRRAQARIQLDFGEDQFPCGTPLLEMVNTVLTKYVDWKRLGLSPINLD